MKQTFTSQEAADYLGIGIASLKRYLANPDVPIVGTLVHKQRREFGKYELDQFKQWLEANADKRLPGRKPAKPKSKTITLPDGTKKRVVLKPEQPEE